MGRVRVVWLSLLVACTPLPMAADSGEQPQDSGEIDDAGSPDAGSPDAGPVSDSGTPDAGSSDSGAPDSGAPDAGSPDSGVRDAGWTFYGSGIGSDSLDNHQVSTI